MVDGKCYKGTALSFGSPHGAVVVDDVDTFDVPTIGMSLGMHRLSPKGASLVFIQVLDKETVKARLWQQVEGEATSHSEAVCVAGIASMMLHKILVRTANVLMDNNSY